MTGQLEENNILALSFVQFKENTSKLTDLSLPEAAISNARQIKYLSLLKLQNI